MNCETQIRQLIYEKLDTIEREEQVKILYAVESGSRAWGFASPDSDYDVRFIYIRPLEYYLALEDKKDYIDWELNEVLDINGWDLVKVLRLFHKSNSTVFEWANSPVVYRTTKRWEQIYETAAQYFSKKACMYHYYGTAKSNYSKFFTEEQVKYKKYFYVIRPLLACRWIEEKGTPPPVLFSTLKETVMPEEIKADVEYLLQEKAVMGEAEKGRRLVDIDRFIETEIERYETDISWMPNDKREDWGVLNRLFRNISFDQYVNNT